MVETRTVVSCAEQQLHWVLGVEPDRCTDASHAHRQHEVHRHNDTVVLPDGSRVAAVSFDVVDPHARLRQPDFGLYLDRRWQPPWPNGHLEWPDFGVPADAAAVAGALTSALERARSGQLVEIGCWGGHGRTGTALACLAILAGQESASAVEWVRAGYCAQAVETTAQEELVTSFGR